MLALLLSKSKKDCECRFHFFAEQYWFIHPHIAFHGYHGMDFTGRMRLGAPCVNGSRKLAGGALFI